MSSDAITITIDPNDPESIRRALNTEWLLTNGLGGYAMGTALGVNTRRYHGLLVAATKPPVGRIVALHSMIEQLIIPNEDGTEEVVDLSTQQFVGSDGEPMLHPGGWRHLREFEWLDPIMARWRYRIGAISIDRVIQTWPGCNGCVLQYQSRDLPTRSRIVLRPLFALRDFHSLNETQAEFHVRIVEDKARVSAHGMEIEMKGHKELEAASDTQTWDRFCYELDRQRGQNFVESLWSPGTFNFSFIRQNAATFEFRLTNPFVDDVELPRKHKRKLSSIEKSASQFVVRRDVNQKGETRSIIAGYPWFGDWGRDTMIALPGLMLCTGKLEEAQSCLLMFAKHLRNGLIPNLFDDYGGAAHYNTVDASLWFVHAVHEYWKATTRSAAPQRPAMSPLIDACRAIIAAYRYGTDFNIHMDDDGLIAAGDETTQLTWMDAKRDGVVFTPRFGKAVEINALWHNALRCLAEMTDTPNEKDDLTARSRQAATSFREKFWWPERQHLYDVLNDDREAASGQLRPNQIFAVSLPFSPLDESQQRAVVKIVGDRLLTPFGLRTLDRDDPSYQGRYEGNMFERDRAYHNGTVWPWLIGPYCEALLRVNGFSADAKRQAANIIQPLIDEMTNMEGGRCIGQIAEVYDGDPPHRPGGCPAQAWSVAEVLRIKNLADEKLRMNTNEHE